MIINALIAGPKAFRFSSRKNLRALHEQGSAVYILHVVRKIICKYFFLSYSVTAAEIDHWKPAAVWRIALSAIPGNYFL